MHGYSPDGTMFCEQPTATKAVERVMYWVREMHGDVFDLDYGIRVEQVSLNWFRATVKVSD